MLRRNFLKALGLLNVAGLWPARAAERLDPTKATAASVRLTGTVTSAGRGLVGVAITDGFSVVPTDARGRYDFAAHSEARFVYLSLPAGHRVPHVNGLARFFEAIPPSQSVHTADFELQPSPESDVKHGFIVWADPQIRNKRHAELLLGTTTPDLKAFAQGFPRDYFHGLGCGDLVWDDLSLFPDYREAVARTGLTFFNLIGNHDLDLSARSDEGSSRTFLEHFGPAYFSFNRGKIHYVVLDDVFFLGGQKDNYVGYVTEQQLAWLERDLALVERGSTVILNLHIPTHTHQHVREQQAESRFHNVANRQRLYEVLQGYRLHIISGHTHCNEVIVGDAYTEHIHGAVCGAWWTGDICVDGTPNGYGVYDIDGDRIRRRYKATGRGLDYQMRVYPPGRHPDYPDEACINLWDYDPSWKVRGLADGVDLGAPVRRIAFDPLAIDTLRGNKLPASYPLAEPKLTDHLFFLKVPAGCRRLEVEAMDGSGAVYREAIVLA